LVTRLRLDRTTTASRGGRGEQFPFTVTRGTVDYSASLDGILFGRGTATLSSAARGRSA